MKTYIPIVFFVTCIAQWYVPGSMIAEQENILETGKVFRFKTAPVDPSDPFRGKYITLNFEAAGLKKADYNQFTRGQKIFVVLREDEEGFAQIADIITTQPQEDADYVEADIMFSNEEMVRINYPFDRFYLEESKAGDAEQVYRDSNRSDTTQSTYAIVRMKNGKSVLEDVMINDRSIVDIVRELNAAAD